jgi:hypothetical protein
MLRSATAPFRRVDGSSISGKERSVRTVIAAAALVAVITAGCSKTSQGEPGGGQAGPAVTVPAPTTTNRYAGNPEPQSVGKPFTFDLEDEGAQLTLTVVRPVVCGIKGFDIPTNRDTAEPAYRLRAPEGTRFCQVDLQVANSGKRQVQFSPGGNIYDTEDRQYEHQEDATAAVEDALASNEFPGVNTVELRPGQRSRTVVVFPIQTGAAPAYVELADGFVETLHGDRNEARVNIASADVRWQSPRGQ